MIELKRQLLHLLGILFVPLAFVTSPSLAGLAALGMAVFFLLFSLYASSLKRRNKLSAVNSMREGLVLTLSSFFNSFERNSSHYKHYGVVLYFLSIALTFYLFPLSIASVAVIVLTVGDAFSTLVGVFFGKNKLFFNSKKTLEGFLGGFFTSLVVLLLIVHPVIALASALIGAVIEVLPVKLNDNVTIPLIVGLVLTLIL